MVTLAIPCESNKPGCIILLAASLRIVEWRKAGYPIEAKWLRILMNTGLCDHATVTDKYNVTQLEALAEFVYLSGKGGGVASVPGEGIHGDGATSWLQSKP